jgi:hypothetical protein
MGEDTCVIYVGEADCEAVVNKLESDPDIRDAGFIYQEAD